ncbi:MAG: YDG domain-containing protein [Kiritimatiellae bacterium]|nr:YDG domain-containing protein [Kiritimatiellia bacterium]
MPKPSIILTIMARLGAVLLRSLVMAAVVALPGGAFAGTTNSLSTVFVDNFESYITNTPLIEGTNGWYGSSSNIVVVSNTIISAAGSTNIAMIPEDCTLSNRFISSLSTNVWIQMDVRSSLYDGFKHPVVDTNMAGAFYINSNGNFVVHNGPASPEADDSVNWVTLTNFSVGMSGTNWVTIGIYEDFNMRKWHLYASTNTPTSFSLVTNNIMFINQGLTNFTGFETYNGAMTSYLDNVSVMVSNKLVATISGSFAVSNKFYDASTTATITNNSLTLNGTAGDVTLVPGAVFDTKDAGMDKTVYLTESVLAGNDALNYTLSFVGAPTATGDIAKAGMTAALVAPITKPYDRLFGATLGVNNYSFGGLVGSETCTVTKTTGAYATSNAAAGIMVSTSLEPADFSGSGGFDTNNYNLPVNAAGGVGDITQAPLTVTLVAPITKPYDRLFGATLGVNNYSFGGLIGSETCAVIKTTGAYATSNAAVGIVVSNSLAPTDFVGTGGGFDPNNYALPTSVSGNVGEITERVLTLGGSFEVERKFYDGTTSATITNNNLTMNTVIDPDVVVLNAVAQFDTPGVGSNKTVYLTGSYLTGADAGNYTLSLAGAPTAVSDIYIYSQTISFPAIPAQPLANGSVELNATASSGLQVSYTNTSVLGSNIAGNILTFDGLGEYTIMASQTGNVNYSAAPPVSRSFAVYDSEATPTTNTIPFTDTFEYYFNFEPLVNGTNGWYGSSLDVIVQPYIVATGTKAAMVPVDCTLSNRFWSEAPTNVWIQMDVRPALFDGSNNPVVDTNVAWMFYLNSNGNFVVYNGPATNADNSTNWVETTNGCVGTNDTSWVTVGIYQDFTQTNWDLYAKTNGDLSVAWILVTNNIGFVNANLTNFAGFDIYNGSDTSYVDNVKVRAPGTVWVDPTNLVTDVYRGNIASNQTCMLMAQTGVWNFTNSISAGAAGWLQVNPVTGIVDSAIGGTNLVVSCGTMPDGSYSGTVTVSAINAEGVPRMRTITVTLNVLGMTVIPSDLTVTNGFMYSNNLVVPSQTFMITNTSAVPVNYTILPQGDTPDWLILSTYSGNIDPDSSTNITVVYTNVLTPGALPPRVYTGEVWVTSPDGGGGTSSVIVAMTVVARPVLEPYPSNPAILTQTIAKGAALIPQAFTLRNGSVAPVVPMDYTLTISNDAFLIQSLSAVNGESTGETNSVTINYTDVSGLDAGVYTAIVQVAAWDAGNNYSPTGTVFLTTNMVVQVTVVALDAPSGVTATDGTYTNKVVVSWNPVVGAINYKVYRYSTFDSTTAEPIGASVTTDFNDYTALPGVRYYYWVSSVNHNLAEGAMSTNRETGYRGLAAPGGVFATDGIYLNKVRVTWPLVDGATGYRVYRGSVGGALTPVYFTVGGVYDDMNVTAGTHYEYRVGATNGMFGSALSVAETGYAFGVPQGLSASDGAYVGKVRVTWNALETASGYQVWRGTHAILPPGGGAIKLATVVSPTFDDVNVSAGVTYYYWVRAESVLAGVGGWSDMASGYGAASSLDILADNLVVLPVQVGVGTSPAIVSFRMGNRGGTNMAGANGTVKMEFFASTNATFGAEGKISIGNVVTQVTLGIGQEMMMNVAGNRLVMPTTEANYNIFVQVLPYPPSVLVDLNPGDNVAMRTGVLRVRSSGRNYQPFNDYDGDGISDLGVYRGTEWSVRSVDGYVWCAGANAFNNPGLPVLGDLDGDRRSDPMAFDNTIGLWQILCSGSGYRLVSGGFGGVGDTALVADYEGVGRDGVGRMVNVAVVNEVNGRWTVVNWGVGVTEWNWGTPGYQQVIGDYNGDGCWDMAVYHEASGLWYIRTLNGQVLVFGAGFGGPGYSPVPGDYDGDGYWDVAVYEQTTGKWYIASLDGRVLAWGIPWGGPGLEPVMGDYDGDGTWDLAVYQEATGLWFIGCLDGRIPAYASSWGGPGYRPIGN